MDAIKRWTKASIHFRQKLCKLRIKGNVLNVVKSIPSAGALTSHLGRSQPLSREGQRAAQAGRQPGAVPTRWATASPPWRGGCGRSPVCRPSSESAGGALARGAARPRSRAGGTGGRSYRGQLVKLAEELVEQLDQLLGRALRGQACEAHDVCEEDAARHRCAAVHLARPPQPGGGPVAAYGHPLRVTLKQLSLFIPQPRPQSKALFFPFYR